MAEKSCCCGHSVYAWVVLVLAVLWLIGALWPRFGQVTIRVPWFQLIIIFAAIGWLTHCKK